jgi:hypothetical protein
MRLRVLLTNGEHTLDLIWLEHTGADVYYGYVGSDEKTSYHASGKRHSKRPGQPPMLGEKHHRLADFSGQLQLCVFGLHAGILRSRSAPEYSWKKADAVLWLDARTLPAQVGIGLGLIEVGNYAAMLPRLPHDRIELRSVHLITNTVPWIYLTVEAVVKPLLGD